MEYKFEIVPGNYEDFASGRVLYSARGTTSFPVRLASELYQRCAAHLKAEGQGGSKITLYDPCCGSASLLTVIGWFHGNELEQVIGSDIDEQVLALAEKNLSLLNISGIEARMAQIRDMIAAYGKDSHKEALDSARRIERLIRDRRSAIRHRCFQADATAGIGERLPRNSVDIVMADVPYGDVARWQGADIPEHPVKRLLEHLRHAVKPVSVVCIIADKKQRIAHEDYTRLEKLKIGKRQAVLLTPAGAR